MITSAFAGVTVSGSTSGLSGVRVTLWRSSVIIQEVNSNASGTYSFTNVDPGDYTVTVYKGGYWPGSTQATVSNRNLSGLDFTIMSLPSFKLSTLHMDVYGKAEIDHDGDGTLEAVIPGDVISAKSARNVLCGLYVVEVFNKYGVLSILGDDPGTSEEVEGCSEGENISLFINGIHASGSINFTNLGTAELNITAAAGVTRTIPLKSGWNLISLGLTPFSDSIEAIFAGINNLKYVMGFFRNPEDEGQEGFRTFMNLPSMKSFSNLTTMDPYHGYWVYMTGDDILQLSGSRIRSDYSRNINQGWNLVGYWLDSSNALPTYQSQTGTTIDSIFGSTAVSGEVKYIMGFYRFPHDGEMEGFHTFMNTDVIDFSTLKELYPNLGFWMYMQNQGLLRYTSTIVDIYAPNNVSASDGIYSDRVRVTWNAVSGTYGYQVFRSGSAVGTYSAISSNWPSTTFDDFAVLGGIQYYYKIKAFDDSGESSLLSECDAGYAALSGSNNLPVIESIEVSGISGEISVNYMLFDPDGDTCSVMLFYSLDDGFTYTASVQINGATSNCLPGTRTLTWNSDNDFADLQTRVRVKLLPNDGTTDGRAGESGMFTVDNRPLEEPVPLGVITLALTGETVMDFVWIAAGSFTMGSPDSVENWSSDEGPQHAVDITQGFYLGKYEVTQRQWQEVTGNNPSYFSGYPNRAVEEVTWNDCQAFITALNSKNIGTFRLPTEAEWEYACRAGSTTPYYWGPSMDGSYCWYWDNSNSQTHDVGLMLPNAWGLFDMSGNVWEWCNDWYDAAYYNISPAIDPPGPSTGSRHVIRGGSWGGGGIRICRSTFRYSDYPTGRAGDMGLRLVVSQDAAQHQSTSETITLTSISLTPSSISVNTNCSYNLNNVIVTAHYSNSSTAEITGETWSKTSGVGSASGSTYYAGSTPGSAVLTASYTESGLNKTIDLSVLVVSQYQLTSISITPTMIYMNPGSNYDLTTIMVIAEYSNGSSREVTEEVWYTTKVPGGTVENNVYTALDYIGSIVALRASYIEGDVTKTADLTVTVVKALSSISINPASITVYANGTYDLSNVTVTAHYSDSSTASLSGSTWSKTSGVGSVSSNTYYAGSNTGTAVLTCSYTEEGITKIADLSLSVVKTISSISINPSSVTVYTNCSYDLSNLSVTAHYSDSTTASVTSVTWSRTSGFGNLSGNMYSAGSNTGSAVLTCTYTEGGVTKTADFSIVVVVCPLTSITLKPSSINVTTGSAYNLSGIQVFATYANGSSREITDETWCISSGNGSISGSIYTAPIDTGNVILAANYTENGVIKTASLNVAVWITPNPGACITVPLTGEVTMKFIWIPSGSFAMGSPEEEPYRNINEGPQHTVNISQGFWLGKYEVTQAQWQAITGRNPSGFQGANYPNSSNRPVEYVSWNVCQSFIATLNNKGYGTFRLPTEAEWEYACRAGTSTAHYWGSSVDGNYMWYPANSGSQTHDVGLKFPNAWGLCDMNGNVWEWCQDLSANIWELGQNGSGDYSNSTVTDPQGPTTGPSRVHRGGSWYPSDPYCRSALRHAMPPDHSYSDLGLRILAVTLNQMPEFVPLTSISISPAFATVSTNGTYNLSNVSVTAYYSDNSTNAVNNLTWIRTSGVGSVSSSTYNAGTSVGTAVLTCSFTEGGVTKTADFTVTVIKTLSSISLAPSSISVNTNGSYNLNNVILTAHYSDSTTAEITGETWSKTSGVGSMSGSTYNAGTSLGSAVLTCSYTENGITKTADFSVTVVKTLSSISISPSSVNLYTSSSYDLSNVVVTAHYSDSTTANVNNATWSRTSGVGSINGRTYSAGSNTGSSVLTCSYTEGGITKTADFSVTVVVCPLTSITLKPSSICVTTGSTYNLSGIQLLATYANGNSKEVNGETWSVKGYVYTTSVPGTIEGSLYTSPPDNGSVVLTASYTENEVTKTVDLVISVVTMTSIALTPTTIYLNIGSSFNLADIKVFANFSDGSSKEVTSEIWSRSSGNGSISGNNFIANTDPGSVVLTARYSEGGVTKTTDFHVSVGTMIFITLKPTLIYLDTGHFYDLSNIKVFADYSDGSSREVTGEIWSKSSGGGSISGSIYTATVDTGSVILKTNYTENGVTKTAYLNVAVWVSPTPGTSKTVTLTGEVTMKFNWIPAGSFTMGSPDSEPNRSINEGPQHTVNITQGFWLGKYEVTQGQWQAIMGNNPSGFKGDQRPVEIGWNDCQPFISKLNNMDISTFILPTEAEWEYACRAGSTTAYYWGDNADGNYMWYNGNSNSQTHDVGLKLPNSWGLFDMSGNVWERCQDRCPYSTLHGQRWIDYSSSTAVDPQGPTTGESRIHRGGSWYQGINCSRSASRDSEPPDCGYTDVGIRLACVQNSLSNITLSPSSMVLPTGSVYDLNNIKITAVYMGNYTVEVCGTWKVKSGIGTVYGNTYTAGPNAGYAILTCSYADNGVTRTAEMNVTLSGLSLCITSLVVMTGSTYNLNSIKDIVIYPDCSTEEVTGTWIVKSGVGTVNGTTYTAGLDAGSAVLMCSYIDGEVTKTAELGISVRECKTLTLTGEVTMDFVWIPAGNFTMGSPNSEPYRSYEEGPQHTVNITHGFWMGKYEVTQAQWQAVMGSNPSGFSGNPNRPVERVTWSNCQSFITALNGKGIGTFRLPTEAEWEFACRAGSTTLYYWGESVDGNYMWYYDNSSSQTHDVGLKLPNPWGLFDMSGNVWEWCSDWFGSYSSSIADDPTGPTTGSSLVLRGGSWYNHDYFVYCRSATRNSLSNSYCDSSDGVRLVVNPITQTKTLSSINIGPSSVNVVTSGTYNLSDVTVTAHYSDSSTVSVTNVTWSKTSGVGSVSDSTYSASSNTGSAVLTCTYTEGGITKTADFAVTVVKTLSTISINPSTINVYTNGSYDLSNVVVTTHYSDSSTTEVTGETWSKISGIGSISESTYNAGSMAGSAVLTCSYTENEVTRTSELSITVFKQLSGITINLSTRLLGPNAAYVLNCIKVTAAYSDSSTAEVTGTWSVKSGGGTVNGSTYTASSSAGSAVLTASYTENGVTKTVDLSVTVNGETHPTGEIKTITLPTDVTMDFIWVPAGNFAMGSPESEPDRVSDEGPQHTVNITQGYYLGKYEVTQAQWQAITGSNPSWFQEYNGYLNTGNRPVEQVSWDDCQTFITTLNSLSLGTFRLPSEAEWEYACRAGSLNSYYWGDTVDVNYLWDSSNCNSQTHDVGLKLPNAWGLYDMSGNVCEWCQDWHSSSYYSSSPTDDPQGPLSEYYRILRGGSWYYGYFGYLCRSAYRDRDYSDHKPMDNGLRLILSP
ncbi:MAG: SUMF1/EgtB/PvdO family nonheme iron enzyme [Candidatus Wallbacteria bacterium]|nr:SUMF1/EgtB/PvdO family nonheme iron enzyme [Candidatus Wallbacteria bacterium]